MNTRDVDICEAVFAAVPFPAEPFPAGADSVRERPGGGSDTVRERPGGGAGAGAATLECKQLPNFVHGFTSKFYALTSTTLTG